MTAVQVALGGIGFLLLIVWCIAKGFMDTFHISNALIEQLLPIVLLAAGVLMLLVR